MHIDFSNKEVTSSSFLYTFLNSWLFTKEASSQHVCNFNFTMIEQSDTETLHSIVISTSAKSANIVRPVCFVKPKQFHKTWSKLHMRSLQTWK